MSAVPGGPEQAAAGQGPGSSPEHSPNHTANRILAIDGPAGAGKSTIAARMAERFGLLNIETGAMYRAFARKALSSAVDLDDAEALARLSQVTTIALLPAPGLRLAPGQLPGSPGNRVLLDGIDVTSGLRTPEIAEAASRVSVHAPIRRWMVALQQQLGAAAASDPAQGIVMEGRDIGTVVFPQASLKIFLFASPEARTERRLAQAGDPAGRSDPAGPEAVLAAIRERDERDRSRAESPLRQAEDAVAIDSTRLSLEEVTAQIDALVRDRWELPAGS